MSREQEYLRRMKALGYEPSLAGMDDEDIEWELERMDRGRQEAQPPPSRTVYRPVDPGLAARIFRQMGRPYDPNAIAPRERYYLNGWDDGEDDDDYGPLMKKPAVAPRSRDDDYRRMVTTKPDIGPLPDVEAQPAFDYDDPWARSRRPNWGPGGSPLRTMEERFGRDDGGSEVQLLSDDAAGSGEGVTEAKGKWNKPLQVVGNIANIGYHVSKFAEEVEKESLGKGDSPELARRKGEDAGAKYGAYLTGVAGGSLAAGRYGGAGAATVVTTTGTIVGDEKIKPLIKDHVMGKTENDYNKPLYPGDTPPGPG